MIALAVGMNTRSSGGDQNGSLLMGSLASGSKSAGTEQTQLSGSSIDRRLLIRYNNSDGRIPPAPSIRPEKMQRIMNTGLIRAIIRKSDYNPVTTMLNIASLNRIANKHFEKRGPVSRHSPEPLCQ